MNLLFQPTKNDILSSHTHTALFHLIFIFCYSQLGQLSETEISLIYRIVFCFNIRYDRFMLCSFDLALVRCNFFIYYLRLMYRRLSDYFDRYLRFLSLSLSLLYLQKRFCDATIEFREMQSVRAFNRYNTCIQIRTLRSIN